MPLAWTACGVQCSHQYTHLALARFAMYSFSNAYLCIGPSTSCSFHSHNPRCLLEVHDLHSSTKPVLVYLDDLFSAAAKSAPRDDGFNLAWKIVRFGVETPFNIGSCVSPVKGHSCQVVGLLITQFSARKWVCSDARARNICERDACSLFQGSFNLPGISVVKTVERKTHFGLKVFVVMSIHFLYFLEKSEKIIEHFFN